MSWKVTEMRVAVVTNFSMISLNYYSVTGNIFQLIVDFWHMLLVNDDDDDVVFLYNSMFCIKKYFF